MQQSLFQSVKSFINIRAVGSTYMSSELCNYTRGTEEVTWWKSRNSNESYRTRTYQTYLKRLGFIKNVRRGIWQVVAHIPEWLNSGHVNCALGYSYGKSYQGEYSNDIRKKIDLIVGLRNSRPATEPLEGKKIFDGNGLATFQTTDTVKACIELRRMGILAVPCDTDELELHIIDRRSAENLAHWMVNSGYELNDYPMLENLLRAYWPEPEVEEVADRATTNLVVLDYVNSKVTITQCVYEDDIEQFLEDNYGDCSAYEYMTMKTLNLEILTASC
jgi:hypothetical protein